MMQALVASCSPPGSLISHGMKSDSCGARCRGGEGHDGLGLGTAMLNDGLATAMLNDLLNDRHRDSKERHRQSQAHTEMGCEEAAQHKGEKEPAEHLPQHNPPMSSYSLDLFASSSPRECDGKRSVSSDGKSSVSMSSVSMCEMSVSVRHMARSPLGGMPTSPLVACPVCPTAQQDLELVPSSARVSPVLRSTRTSPVLQGLALDSPAILTQHTAAQHTADKLDALDTHAENCSNLSHCRASMDPMLGLLI